MDKDRYSLADEIFIHQWKGKEAGFLLAYIKANAYELTENYFYNNYIANWGNEACNTYYNNTRNSLYDLQEVWCTITGTCSDSTHCQWYR